MKRVLPDALRRLSRAPGRGLLPPTAPPPPLAGPRGVDRADGRPAHPGNPQLRLLRAPLPRQADGDRAGRGHRPRRRPGPRLHADHPGPAAGCTSSTAGWTTTGSTRSSGGRIRWSGCRAWSTPTAPATWRSPTRLGTGVADDKAVYAFVPEIIKYYLDEEPILPNVQTYLCAIEDDRALRPRAPRQAGGQGGRRIGWLRDADRPGLDQRPSESEFRRRDRRRARAPSSPSRWSRCPSSRSSIGDRLRAAPQDLRPFVLRARRSQVLPGGLTRVALKAGSLVVNSSQGGGSRDTWVLAGSHHEEPGTA